jgi:hypothetical protein
MDESKREEMIAALWLIVCLLCIENGIIWGAWLTGLHGIFCVGCSLWYARKEIRAERRKP